MMTMRPRRRIPLLIGLLALFALPAAAQDPPKPDEKKPEKTEIADINGKWDLTVETQQGPMTVSATFKTENDKVTGKIEGPQGEMAISGTISESGLTFSGVVTRDNGELTIVFTGTAGREKMEGKVDFGGRGEGSWSAQRPKQQ